MIHCRFCCSGIRPVRKFPVNFKYPIFSQQTASSETSKDLIPSRMSAMLKANPVSLAQREKMMRKAGPAISRFNLSKVSEVSGLNHEGWFSSKLIAMSYLSKCKTSKFANVKIVPSLSESDFISSGKKLKLQYINDKEIEKIKDKVGKKLRRTMKLSPWRPGDDQQKKKQNTWKPHFSKYHSK